MTNTTTQDNKTFQQGVTALRDELQKFHDERAAILEARYQVAQAMTQRDGGYYPDELPFGVELAEVSRKINAIEVTA